MSNWVMINEDDRDFLAHSSGPWKKHKYISKDGKKYIYRKIHGKNPNREASNKEEPKVTHQAKTMSPNEAREARRKKTQDEYNRLDKSNAPGRVNDKNAPKKKTYKKAMSLQQARDAEEKRQVENRSKIRERRMLSKRLESNKPKTDTSSGSVMNNANEAREARRKKTQDEYNRLNKSNAPGRVNDKNAPKKKTYKKAMSSPQQARDTKKKRIRKSRRIDR